MFRRNTLTNTQPDSHPPLALDLTVTAILMMTWKVHQSRCLARSLPILWSFSFLPPASRTAAWLLPTSFHNPCTCTSLQERCMESRKGSGEWKCGNHVNLNTTPLSQRSSKERESFPATLSKQDARDPLPPFSHAGAVATDVPPLRGEGDTRQTTSLAAGTCEACSVM
jgi:hypothetical protein